MNGIGYIAADNKITFERDVNPNNRPSVFGFLGMNRQRVISVCDKHGITPYMNRYDTECIWDNSGKYVEVDTSTISDLHITFGNSMDKVLSVIVDVFYDLTGVRCELEEVGLKSRLMSYHVFSEWDNHPLPKKVIKMEGMSNLFQKWFIDSKCSKQASFDDFNDYFTISKAMTELEISRAIEKTAVEEEITYYLGTSDEVMVFNGEYETVQFRVVALFKDYAYRDNKGEYVGDTEREGYRFNLIEIVSIDGKAPEYEKAEAVSA